MNRTGREDHGELLADFAVTGVLDPVIGIGVDTDETGNFDFDTGLFSNLSDCSDRERLADI